MIENVYKDIDVETITNELNDFSNIEYPSLKNIISELDDNDNWNAKAKDVLTEAIKKLNDELVENLRNTALKMKEKTNKITEYLQMYDEYVVYFELMEKAEKEENIEEYEHYKALVQKHENELNAINNEINKDLV